MDWIAMALSVLGLVFNARKSIWCWPLWLAGSAIWLVVFHQAGQWAAFSLFCVYQVLNVYGWVHWHIEARARGRKA